MEKLEVPALQQVDLQIVEDDMMESHVDYNLASPLCCG